MCFADSNKRPLEMVLYDPAAAAAAVAASQSNKRARQDEAAKSSSSSSSSSGAMVPYAGRTVLDVAPISIAPPPQLRPPPRAPAAGAGRAEPPCLRSHFLVALGLRADLPVHFIGDKRVTSTDLDPHQNRFRIPRQGVETNLRPILTVEELDAANLLVEDPTPPRPKRPKPQQQQQNDGAAADDAEAAGKKVKKPKKKGKVHGGLPVKLLDLHAGAKELRMARWSSSRGTVVKGEGYLQFIRRCGLKESDNVEIWAFVQRRFRLFGKDVFNGSLLHILVVNKQEEPRCCFCHGAPAHHVPPPSTTILAPHAGGQLNLSIGIRADAGEQDPIRYIQ